MGLTVLNRASKVARYVSGSSCCLRCGSLLIAASLVFRPSVLARLCGIRVARQDFAVGHRLIDLCADKGMRLIVPISRA